MTDQRTRSDHRPGLAKTHLHGTDVLVAARGANVLGADVRGINMSIISPTGWRVEFGKVPPTVVLLGGIVFVGVEFLRMLD